MFRKMRRINQQVSNDACIEVLKSQPRAAFSVIGENGYPYTVPINFYYDEKENKIYFHGAKSGHKYDALNKLDKVCFTVWNQGFKNEGAWEYNATSVVIFGRVKLIEDENIINEKLRSLALKYYPTNDEVEKEMQSDALKHVGLYAIAIEHMTGKLVNEK